MVRIYRDCHIFFIPELHYIYQFIYFFKFFQIADVGVWTPWTEWSEWTYLCDDATRYMDRQCNGTKPVSTMPSRHFTNAPPKTPQYGGQRECEGASRENGQRNQPYCDRE